MIGIIISIVILICVVVFVLNRSYDIIEALLYFFTMGMPISLLMLLVIMPFTGGLYENYGTVNQIGYLTNFSERGVIYKTHEGELQKGVGEQATAENAFDFSITDPVLIEKLSKYLGSTQRIKLTCKQWLCMPYKNGSTNKEAIGVEEIE